LLTFPPLQGHARYNHGMQTCPACGTHLAEGATQCHACLVAVPEEQDVYDLSSEESTTIPPEWEGGAVYTLERSARCPLCKELIRSLRVIRIKRTQVSFTSPLPRAGRVIVCPTCLGIVSADVSTF
jgi:hypothetical protein